MNPADCIAAVVHEHETNGDVVEVGGLDSAHEVLLVLREAPGMVVLTTVGHEQLVLVEALGIYDGLQVVQIVHLLVGIVHVPVLQWVQPRCSWPGCGRVRAIGSMRFQGGRLCPHHEDEARDRMAEAADEAGR